MLNKSTQTFLNQSVQCLLTDKCARLMAKQASVDVWLQDFLLRLSKVSEQSDLLRVAVVGELKAGKSTLINAILRREITFVDTFEATTTVAMIVPGKDEKVVINDPSGKCTTKSIADFVAACKRFEYKNVDSVEITVNHDLPVILLDTPGMGTISEGYEARAEMAIVDSADLVVWVMDPGDLLSANEGAFLKRARSIGLPIWCIISKTDELSDDEINQCVDCIVETTGLGRKEVLALSSRAQIETGFDAGVSELITKIRQMSQKSDSVRHKAETAKGTELLDEFQNAIRMIASHLRTERDWLDGERAILGEEARIVKSTLIRDAKSYLADALIMFFTEKLATLSHTNMSPENICRILVESFIQERLPTISEKIAARIHDKAVIVWDEQFEDRHADLSRQIENLTRNEMQDGDSEIFLRNQLLVTEERREAVKQGFGATPAALGAAALTLFFDPTGITANLVAMGAGALAGHFTGKIAGDLDARTETETVVSPHSIPNYARQMSDVVVDQLLAPAINKYIDSVVSQALDERCRQRLSGIAECEMKATFSNIVRISRGVDSIKLTGEPGDNFPVQDVSGHDNTATNSSNANAPYAIQPVMQLSKIIEEHGVEICQSPKQVEGLLKDLCGNYTTEIFLLVLCLSSGKVDRIMSLKGTMPEQSLVISVANELQQSKSINLDAAKWAVEAWTGILKQMA